MGKTSSNVKDRYNKKAYDEIKVRVEKGNKTKIQEHAVKMNESTNAFICRAIYSAINNDNRIEAAGIEKST